MKKISRRSFLAAAGVSAAALALTACGGSSNSTAASTATSAAASTAPAGDAAAAASDPKVTLVYAEVNPLDTIVGQTGSHFKEKVEELTGGSVVVDVQASGVLGSVFTCYDSHKMILVIDNRNKVLVDGPVQKILHITVNMNRLVGGSSLDRHNRDVLSTLHICNVQILHAPEKVSLGNGSYIFALWIQNRNTGKFPVFHFLKSLPQSFILENVGNITFRC